MSLLPWLRAAVLLLLALAAPALAAPRDPRLRGVRDWAFAIGARQPVERLAAFDLVVVDGEDTPRASIRALRRRGVLVLGYLSVGTIERGRSWYRRAKPYRLELWRDWGEWYADVRAPGYRRLIARRVAPSFMRKGFSGLFLDNTDMVEGHHAQAAGMRALAGSLARLVRRRGALLFTQNGERSIGPTLPLYDGWNREDVTSSFDFDTRSYRAVPPAAQRAARGVLRRFAAAGLFVTATDYAPAGDRRLARSAIDAACAAGALPYVADIALRRLPPRPLRCQASGP